VGLLIGDEYDQTPYLFGWLKIVYEALLKNAIRPGQALILAGEHDSGKSLLQNLITLNFRRAISAALSIHDRKNLFQL